MKMGNLHLFKNGNNKIMALRLSLVSGCIMISLLCSVSFGQTFVDQHGLLKVSGNKIVDKNNQPITLHGMSMYPWASQGLQYYTPEAIVRFVKEWKCTVIRIPIRPAKVSAQTYGVTEVVDACIANGIYAIIDWHSMAGANADSASKFLRTMATKYGNTPNVMYETWNEPVNETWPTIKTYHEKVISAIRAVDPDNIIICGTPFYDQKPHQAAADPITSSKNIAYSLHFYAATHRQSIRDNAAAALTRGVALFATEYGTGAADGNGTMDAAETKLWWTFMDANGIGSTNWSVSALEETTAIFKVGTSPFFWKDSHLKPTGVLVRDYIISKYQGVGIIKNKNKPAQYDLGGNAGFSISGDASQSTNVFNLNGTQITSQNVQSKSANGVYVIQNKVNSNAKSFSFIR